MPTIKIDGTEYEVEAGNNLLQACLNLGLDLPYFCWHPAMGSIGACRQCAVVQYMREEDSHGRIVMACMTPVVDGAIFSLNGDQASTFREAIVESLMLNHPHDCPVCAEGGECHLQDMTVMVGHRDRHYRGKKNTHRNQYLGPLINHEMNRCITCYRCTRYYRDYAGGTDLAAMAAHDHVYFGRHQAGVLENEFAGNLVEVCPTGVFTDKSLVQDYTRKWDLQTAPSVCVGCAVGCNTLPGERYGRLKRIHNRFNREVNGYFLCDRGRFGGKFVNSEKRLDFPAQRDAAGTYQAIHTEPAMAACIEACRQPNVVGIGSPRASVEANYLLQQLAGAANFCSGIADQEHALVQRCIAHLVSSPAHNPCLQEIEAADAILILGEDITHTAPRVALSLRQSVRNKAFAMAAGLKLEVWQDAAIRNLAQNERSPLHIVAGYNTALADVAASNTCLPIAAQLALARSVAKALGGSGSEAELADAIATDLGEAQRPLIICGTSSNSAALIDCAAQIAETLSANGKQPMLSLHSPECNSTGVGLLSRNSSLSFAQIMQRAENGDIDTLLILENDLYRRADSDKLQQLFTSVATVIGIDTLDNRTLSQCDWVLPAASFSECEGTLVSSEGRAQRSFAVHSPAQQRLPSWQWLSSLIAGARPEQNTPQHFDQVCESCAAACPWLTGITAAAPDYEFRNRGLKVPRQPHRYSGRTAMRADISVHEPKQAVDSESALAFTMEGSRLSQPGALQTQFWSPGWNSNQSLHKFQIEVGGPLRGGTAGVRLFEALQMNKPSSADVLNIDTGAGWQLFARQRIFGSDELSAVSDGIAELVGNAFIELRADEAAVLEVEAGAGITAGGQTLELRINNSLPAGCASFSAGYRQTEHLYGGQTLVLSKAENWTRRSPQIIGSDSSSFNGNDSGGYSEMEGGSHD